MWSQRREIGYSKRPVCGNVVGWKRPRRSERRQVQHREDCVSYLRITFLNQLPVRAKLSQTRTQPTNEDDDIVRRVDVQDVVERLRAVVLP